MILASMNACNVCSETLLNFSPKFLGSDECLKSELKKKKKKPFLKEEMVYSKIKLEEINRVVRITLKR